METNTAKNFALQLGSLIALYASLSSLLVVTFGVINIIYPDVAAGYWEYDSTQSSIRFGIAMLLVFFPTYLFLTRLVNEIRRKETGAYLALTKWVVYLSILVGSLVLLGDFVTVILAYLNGEITIRFILKALAVAVAVVSAVYYYYQDAKGHWNTHEGTSKLFALGATAVVVLVLILGFSNSDTPTKVREMKIDNQQVSDLSDMQYRIEDHYRINNALPKDVATVYVGVPAPKAAEGKASYEYKVVDTDTYELCATFAYPSQNTGAGMSQPSPAFDELKNPYNNWDHGASKTCFERTIIKNPTTLPAEKMIIQ
jgi:hypothetical protein